MTYILDPTIEQNSIHIIDLDLCELRIQNEARFPWLILIPKQSAIIELIDLTQTDQIQLMKEINQVSKAMKTAFDPDKLNVATLGNIVKQLHIHIIARYTTDLAWPNPVWGFFEQSTGYAEDVLTRRIHNIQKQLSNVQ